MTRLCTLHDIPAPPQHALPGEAAEIAGEMHNIAACIMALMERVAMLEQIGMRRGRQLQPEITEIAAIDARMDVHVARRRALTELRRSLS